MRAHCGHSCIVLLLFSFLYLAYSLPSGLVDTKKCKKSNGDFPKLGSYCRSFYRCNNWIPVEMICPLDQHFFPAKGYCVWPEEFPCLDRPDSEQCPELNGKFLKHGTNCKVYYDCCDGRPSEKSCPGDTLFDSSSRKCDWPELVTCPDDKDPESKECPSANGKFLKPGSGCKYYYDCNNFKPTAKKCPGDTIFDQTKEKCDWPELVNCADDDTTTKEFLSSTLTSTTKTEPSPISSSRKSRITTTVTIQSTSFKTPTPDSDEDSSENGKTSSGESKEENTKHEIKSTYPTFSTTSVLDKITTPSTEDLKNTSSSDEDKSTDLPVTSYKSSSAIVTSTEAKTEITTELEISTVSEMQTSSTSRIDVTTYPVVSSDKTDSDDIIYKDKDPTTTTSVTPTSTTEDVTRNIFCPKPDGYFPHPSDKHKFVACVGGNPTVMDCPSDLVYDHKTKSCQYKRRKNSRSSFE